jgi:hypothetical protein
VQNPRLTIEEAKNCQEPDIVFYQGISRPLETDITVVNPCCPSKLQRTLKKTGFALREAGREKVRRYAEQAEKRTHEFAPLAFETHGAMGEEVGVLLRKLAANTPDTQGHGARSMALDLAITLARGNAACARSTVARAFRNRDQLRAS